MAGFAIVGRVIPVAFGIIFSLSGSVGPIIGQNYGAKRHDRVRRTLTDGLIFAAIYTLTTSLILFLFRHQIAEAFNAAGRTVRSSWCSSAPSSASAGPSPAAQFVANAAFNNLGRAKLSTWFNWGKATLGTIPFATCGRASGRARGHAGGHRASARSSSALPPSSRPIGLSQSKRSRSIAMSLMTLLDQAQGGSLYPAVARSLDLDENQTRKAMRKLCPAIAARLQEKAAKDDELFQTLLDMIETAARPRRSRMPKRLTDAEAVSDGNAILDDVYGSRNDGHGGAARRPTATHSRARTGKLAPISAIAVVAALAQANRPHGAGRRAHARRQFGQRPASWRADQRHRRRHRRRAEEAARRPTPAAAPPAIPAPATHERRRARPRTRGARRHRSRMCSGIFWEISGRSDGATCHAARPPHPALSPCGGEE